MIDTEGNPIIPVETYEISVFDIKETEDAFDSFSAVRVWWSDNINTAGPYSLAPNDQSAGRRQGVISIDEYKTFTAQGKYIYFGAVEHMTGTTNINDWPVDGTSVCVHIERRVTPGASGPGASGPGIIVTPGTLRPCDVANGFNQASVMYGDGIGIPDSDLYDDTTLIHEEVTPNTTYAITSHPDNSYTLNIHLLNQFYTLTPGRQANTLDGHTNRHLVFLWHV